MTRPITVFYVYAETDETLRQELEKHLALLQRQGVLASWQESQAGALWEQEREQAFNEASLILLLVSADFVASDVCYQKQMQRALERQTRGEVQVLPILVRPVELTNAPFTHLPRVPTNGQAVTVWSNQDAAWTHITEGIRCVLGGKPLPIVQEQKEATSYRVENQGVQSQVVGEHNTINNYFVPPASPLSSPTVSPMKPIWMVPYARNPFFTGRDAVLDDLHQRFKQRQAQTVSQPQAMSGLGGIGKTQIVVEYAYRYAQEYEVMLWVRADVRENLVSGYVEIAQVLKLPRQSMQNQMIIVQEVKQWLTDTERSWLLILDNADELGMLREFLPTKYHGHILLTTRAQSTGKFASRFEVETMNEAQGALLLLRRAELILEGGTLQDASPADVALAKQISEVLGGLPLALDQAGAYVEETRCSLADYLKFYQARSTELLRVRGGLGKEDDHPEPVSTTWSLSFQKVEEKNPGAVELLRFCAFLAPDSIPEEMFTQGIALLGPSLSWTASDPLRFNEAIKIAGAYSLLQRELGQQSLSMHRLVQAVVRNMMDGEVVKQWEQRVVQVINAAFPYVEFVRWAECERVLPHALACATLIEQEQFVFLEASSLLNQVGYYLHARGRYNEVEPLWKRALAIREQELGPSHPDTITSMNNLAGLYYTQGRYVETEPLWKRALKISEQALGATDPSTATSLNNLAALYQAQGKYTEAEPLWKRALKISEKLGPTHLSTATSLNNLAMLYQEQGRYSEAEPLLVRALLVREQTLGLLHPETATILNNLAMLYDNQKKYKEAEPLYMRALAIREQELGPSHPDTATCLNNLAELYRAQGRYAEAEPVFLRALVITEQELGPTHPNTALILYNLAGLFSVQKKYKEAEPLAKRALKMWEQSLGAGHPRLKMGWSEYVRLLRVLGRKKEAAALEAEGKGGR